MEKSPSGNHICFIALEILEVKEIKYPELTDKQEATMKRAAILEHGLDENDPLPQFFQPPVTPFVVVRYQYCEGDPFVSISPPSTPVFLTYRHVYRMASNSEDI